MVSITAKGYSGLFRGEIQTWTFRSFVSDRGGGSPVTVLTSNGGPSTSQIDNLLTAASTDVIAVVTGSSSDDLTAVFRGPESTYDFCGHAMLAIGGLLHRATGAHAFRVMTSVGPCGLCVEPSERGWHVSMLDRRASTFSLGMPKVTALLDGLRISWNDLDPRFPVRLGYSGNYHPMVGLRTRSLLSQIGPDLSALGHLFDQEGWTTAHVFYCESLSHYHVRNVFPRGHAGEDPASGSAAIAFGDYLRTYQQLPDGGNVLLQQGEDMGEPCDLEIVVPDASAAIEVGGFVEMCSI